MNVKSWKTTLGGALLALGPVLKTHGTAAWMFWLSEACMIIGGLILGLAAKDKDVTGVGESAKRVDDATGWRENAGGK